MPVNSPRLVITCFPGVDCEFRTKPITESDSKPITFRR